MYIPLFAVVNVQYKKAENPDYPRIIALDEAFAGVDDKNISNIFYSGDFDPEGLSIAEKVLVRNDGYAKLWHMGREDYELCLSEEEISEERIHKLDKIKLPCLQEVKSLMRETKKAGYQERFIETMLYDICHNKSL